MALVEPCFSYTSAGSEKHISDRDQMLIATQEAEDKFVNSDRRSCCSLPMKGKNRDTLSEHGIYYSMILLARLSIRPYVSG